MADRSPVPAFLLPTPAGAYFAVADNADHPLRRFVRRLLACSASPRLEQATLQSLCNGIEDGDADRFVREAEDLGWVQYMANEVTAPTVPIANLTGLLVKVFSGNGKCLLADGQGFCVARHGFDHRLSEELSALSADLATLHQRHLGVLNHALDLPGSAWALTNAAGHSQLGFWPLYIADQRFVLTIQGVPFFNRPQLVELIWALYQRYAVPASTTQRLATAIDARTQAHSGDDSNACRHP